MAIGAYTTAILSADHGWPQLLTLPVAGLVAGIAGFLFGFPALRLAGVYLALATFALAVIIPSVAIAFSGSRAAAAAFCSRCRRARSAGSAWTRGSTT